VIVACRPVRRVARLAEHGREDLRIERPLIERDLTEARHSGHDLRLDVDDANGAHDAGARLRVALRDLAKFERGLRSREERIAAHRDGRRAGMRRLPGKTDQVPFDSERAKHHAGWLAK